MGSGDSNSGPWACDKRFTHWANSPHYQLPRRTLSNVHFADICYRYDQTLIVIKVLRTDIRVYWSILEQLQGSSLCTARSVMPLSRQGCVVYARKGQVIIGTIRWIQWAGFPFQVQQRILKLDSNELVSEGRWRVDAWGSGELAARAGLRFDSKTQVSPQAIYTSPLAVLFLGRGGINHTGTL